MKKLIIIGGPTASGKTGLSILLANHYETEIVNADSRQFYKQMDIGTAKPTKAELALSTHHFVNFLNPDEEYNAGKFEIDALKIIQTIFEKKDYAIVVGGSGLYIKTLCDGMDNLPESNPEIRNKYNNVFTSEGIEALQKLLLEKDSDYYTVVDLKNPHRLIRALEVIEQSGQTYTSLRKRNKSIRPFEIIKIAIEVPREALYERINFRVDEMIKNGLINEVKSLSSFRKSNALQTVGYSEIFAFLEGKLTQEEAIDLIKKNSRNYAKRQMTWFKKDAEFKWFQNDLLKEILEYIENYKQQ